MIPSQYPTALCGVLIFFYFAGNCNDVRIYRQMFLYNSHPILQTSILDILHTALVMHCSYMCVYFLVLSFANEVASAEVRNLKATWSGV